MNPEDIWILALILSHLGEGSKRTIQLHFLFGYSSQATFAIIAIPLALYNFFQCFARSFDSCVEIGVRMRE